MKKNKKALLLGVMFSFILALSLIGLNGSANAATPNQSNCINGSGNVASSLNSNSNCIKSLLKPFSESNLMSLKYTFEVTGLSGGSGSGN